MAVERSPSPSRLRLALFTLVAVALFFAGLEGVSRLFYRSDCGNAARLDAWLQRAGAQPPRSLEESFKRSMPMPYDPYLIWHLILNYRGLNLGVQVEHNSRGFRSPEIPLKKPADTVRVLLLGDSTIYGHGVETDRMLRSRLEQALQAKLAPRTVQVVNAGIPGYSSLQSRNLLRRVAWRYEPDVVVIANLWSDSILDRFEDREVIYGTGYKAAISVAGQWMDEHLAPGSAFYCVVKEKVVRVRQPQGPSNQVRQPGSSTPEHRRSRVSLEDYEANLEAMAAFARDHGAAVAFAMLANRRDVGEPDDRQPTPSQYQPYRDTLRRVASSLNAPLVDMAAAFARKRAAEPSIPLFLDLVHPTAEGNAVMAEALEQTLLTDPATRQALETP